jgi:uncharacterized membrane protein
MIEEPLFVLLILVVVVVTAQKVSKKYHNAKWLKFIPTPVWCYIPPTILTTLGILPPTSNVYTWIMTYVLPACLILLLMTTDLKSLQKVGETAILAMSLATLSVVAAGIISFFVYRNELGTEAASAIGTMTGSLIGGTVNMVAVKQATGLSDLLFTPLFISDITVVYLWMTFLMILSTKQKKIDKFLKVKQKKIDQLLEHTTPLKENKKSLSTQSLFTLLMIGFGLSIFILWVVKEFLTGVSLSEATWVIVLVTTVGLLLSTTKFSKKEAVNSQTIGYFLLYLVLAGTGAKAKLTEILEAPIFLSLGLFWIVVHACLLLLIGRLFRIPSAMLATASQANLGGVASAPVVASTFEPKLVPIALILAILGNAIGNYLGIFTAQFLQGF